jgi:hypothetical protein
MNERIVGEHQLLWDGKTVWINAPTGECVGRFGVHGIDFHHSVAEQLQGHPQCLACTHHRPSHAEWVRFRTLVRDLLDVALPAECRPAFIRHTVPFGETGDDD